MTLNKLRHLRALIVRLRHLYYTRFWGMDIHPTCQFSLRAQFDRTYPRGVHIGPETYVAFNAVILTHDRTRGLYVHTRVGARCFIGAHSMILPGVEIGDECVVGAGAVVNKSVPARCIVAGNPAQIIRRDIEVGPYGRFLDADETERRLREAGAFAPAAPASAQSAPGRAA